jgi:cbb3-type cytochrome oxidase cytochrome c subunit
MNLWFAVSSALLTVVTVWLIVVDFDRPWKAHQSQYMDNQAVLAHLEYLTTQQDSFQQKLDKRRQAVEATRADIDMEQNPEYAGVIEELSDLKAEAYGLDLTFKQRDALIVVTRSNNEAATAVHGLESEEAQAIRSKLKADETSRMEALLAKQAIDDRIKNLDNQRKAMEQPYQLALRELTALEKQVGDAQAKHDSYGSLLYRKGFNIPLLDFAAPPGTPARFEVKQVVAQNVKTKLNFLEGYKVDRCTTCHVVIDDANYSEQALVAKFEAFLPAIREELTRREDAAAPHLGAIEPPRVSGYTTDQIRDKVADHWDDVSREERAAYFIELQDQVNSYLAYENMPTLNLGQPLLAHPNLDLFLNPDSAHPMKQVGCTVCHEGNGEETDFVLAAHTPKTAEEREAWASKHYDTNLGVPTMTWQVMEHYWNFPMIPPKYSEAGCAKCHDAIDDLAQFNGRPQGTKLRKGKSLFTQLGCINCHAVENLAGSRQVGPDLAHIGSKLDDGFLHNWIHSPPEFRPSTRMPHFFDQENNGMGSENEWDPNPELRTQTETIAMAAYLRHVSKPWNAEAMPQGLTGDDANGQTLFATVGCLACHGNIAEFGQRWITDDLTHRMKMEAIDAAQSEHRVALSELNNKIKNPQDHQLNDDDVQSLTIAYAELLKSGPSIPDTSADSYTEEADSQVSAMDLNEQVRYAMRHFTAERRSDFEDRATKEQLKAGLERRDPDPLLTYVPPEFTRFAPDLSGIGTKVTLEWLYSWLREPRHYSSYTKMPKLRLTDQETADIAAYLMTLKHDTFNVAPFAMDSEVLGELDTIMSNVLSGQHSVATIEKLRDDDRGVLTTMLETEIGSSTATLDLESKKLLFVGKKMIAHYGCFACHAIEGFEGTPAPGTELTEWGEKNIHQLDFAFFGGAYHDTLGHSDEFANLYPEDREDLVAWAALSANPHADIHHTHASFATHKLLNPRIWDREKIKKPYEKLKMPNFYLAPDETEALTTYLLSRRPPRVADSLQIAYEQDAQGPIAEGRRLVQELNCLGCHKIEENTATMHQFIVAMSDDEEEDDWDDEEEDDEEAEEEVDESGMARLGESYGGEYDEVNGPPWLRGQGAKAQAAWMHEFLLNVDTLRPWEALQVRMPSFYLTSDEASKIVDYFGHLAMDEADTLKSKLASIHGAIDKSTAEDAHQHWADLEGAGHVARILRDYAVSNRLVPARTFDFSRKGETQKQKAFGSVLQSTEFFARLFDIQYPFEHTGFEWMDEDRFAQGEALFQELQCLSCHVLGDPEAPGSNRTPSAPNLSLTHKRLRYEWFHQWMQQPGKIQPGTKMPQWFPNGRSAYGEYSDDLRLPFEQAYGESGEEQMRLLMDYVWQAGLINHTAVTKPAGSADTSNQDDDSRAAVDSAAGQRVVEGR